MLIEVLCSLNPTVALLVNLTSLLPFLESMFSIACLVSLVIRHFILQKRRGPNADPVSEDDILRAIGKLKALGSGFRVIKVGSQRLVRSVPGELNTDKSILLELAQTNGCISELQIVQVRLLPPPLYQYHWLMLHANRLIL
jgi:hypothetical protein